MRKEYNDQPESFVAFSASLEVGNTAILGVGGGAERLARFERLLRRGVILLLLVLLSSAVCPAQPVAIKTNLLYGGYAGTPNLSLEVGLGKRSSLELGGGFNWFKPAKEGEFKKKIHWLGQLEYRFWFCRPMNGHFLGLHLLGGQYNISGHELPLLFGSGSANYRYEGWAVGAGISYGYQFYLAKRWSLELSVGVGYARLAYDQYRCETCGVKAGSDVRHYFGPTKGGISLIYLF